MTRTIVMHVVTAATPLLLAGVLQAQASTPRDLRIEVRDKGGRPIPEAQVTFFLSGDSAFTDSSGIAKKTVLADSAINITIRKLGFEPRNARFTIGKAPAFNIRVALGEAGQKLPEVEVKDSYPGEPWRVAFEQRRKRGGGQFRDISYFPGGVPFSINDWFNGLPGVRTGGGTGGDINIPRCRNLGVWIDNQHATSPGSTFRAALQSLPPQDIAAFELYTSNTPAQFTGQNEDCSLLVWTRLR
ncbi:MAG: hypothetical protein V4813_10840 [Gemmatimonadota bacterium]